MSELEGLPEPRPRAVFIGAGFSQEEQDDLEKRATSITVVKSLPHDKAMMEKFKDLELRDKVPKIVKELLDRRREEFTKITDTARAVTQNAV